MKTNILFLVIAFTLEIAAHSGKVVQKFATLYSNPSGLTFDGKNLWLADYKADKLSSINPLNGEVLREIPSPGFWPTGLAWDGKYLWNADEKQKKIFKIDPQSGEILFTIDSPSDNPQGLAWDGKTLWVSDSKAKKIMMIDLSDGTAIKSIDAPASSAGGLTFDGSYLWCTDRLQNEIYMIDPDKGEVIVIIDSPGPYPVGLAWDGEYLWNVDYQTDQIYKIIRQDSDTYKLDNTRKAKVTFTHEVTPYGQGKLKNLDVYIAIPENLPQQKIINMEFLPNNYSKVKDKWSQEFAHFNYKDVKTETKIQSIMIVNCEVSDIDYFIFPDRCGTIAAIPEDIRKNYTSNESKYQLDDRFIQDLSKKVVGEEKNTYWIARKIFDYVRSTLEYKLEGGWNVAPVVLQRGTGSCSEYTFSFIALCRAAGLPARYVGSIVVRGDDASIDEVFHRWPEIYLPNYGWIPIDPQGGDKPLPRDRAMNIGHLPNRFLITTHGGGDSEFMGWYYNSFESYQTDPQVKVNIEYFGEWEPLEKN
ncbi:MAG: transglutaminase [Ignavibacteria bacterium RIFOXYB2_FULL_35_12]|nr:MAG: transglutaminase [Ignavibacteria bacterium GWF2_35_20]OGU78409.1 MAG: transglutaminase [Ignavibacteria bacterium RIFOXYA2_FULL_35_9]OGU88493.1 MAG: transglutaminase [Ignavibacteria bacterium RIFOXYC12_FULL_35_11]OGU91306.1 MAG: transglutaminase [Ignavibacteria bacterium RIFOXYA12_FULL_35_25]OGU96947.1 MAG: transglutaminase [Ignavibacteria bacterium RIFOXYB12_FULL_35_14]OGU98702.1 MAG: transglutaminase [Ignavibacteria bacterium RIFOXYC2_FULL_35_16]OGV05509.1 MAG: transglutaminase [Igna